MKLTDKEELILDCINNFINKYGYSPSVRELCEETKIKSTSTMHDYLLHLKSEGYIDFVNGKSRTIRVIEGRKNEQVK